MNKTRPLSKILVSTSLVVLTATFSTSKSLAAASCDWASEVFKSKVGDACQKEFEGKLSDDQDKVFSRRMFKDWNVPKDTEVTSGEGLLEVINEADGTFFQMAYISKDPTIAWINDKIIIDDSTDKSVYRRVQRILAKADETKTAALDPVRTFILGNEASAAAKSYLQDLAFVYTINGVTASAQQILTDKNTAGAIEYEDTSGFSRFFGLKDQYTCNGKKLQGREFKINGKKVKVEPNSRNEFFVSGLIDGKLVKVDMQPHAVREGEKPIRYTTTDKEGNKHVHVRYGLPCQGSSKASIADVCKDAWADWAKQNVDSSGAYDLIVKMRGDKLNFAHDIRCEDIYTVSLKYAADTVKDKIRSCRQYFKNRFPPKAARFEEDSATMSVCDAGKCTPIDAENFAKAGNAELNDPSHKVSREMLIAVREGYRTALKEAGLDAEKLCPAAPGGSIDPNCAATMAGNCEAAYPEMPACTKWGGKTAKKLDASVIGHLEKKFAEVQNPVRSEARAAGSSDRHELEGRLLGLMMLGDCCADSKCADKLADAKKIQLNHGTTTK